MNKNTCFFTLLPLLFLALIISCASTPKDSITPVSDGAIYSYDYERFVDSIEVTYAYKAYGMDGMQTVQKKSWGNAVYMENGCFVDPETRIVLQISNKGNVTSPQNPSIQGTYDKNNGNIFFQGYYEENGQIQKIVVHGSLKLTDDTSRADTSCNGDFILTDNGTGRKQKVTIENGLYLWEYADKTADDFTQWPVLVHADGSVNCGYEMTVRSGIKGLSEMLVSSSNTSIGKVTPNGTLEIKTLTQNYGTGQSGQSKEITFAGTRGSENYTKITKASVTDSEIHKTLTKSQATQQNPVQENPPEWYFDFIPNDEMFLYGTARKTHADKTVALQIAELTAVSQLRAALSKEVLSYTEGKKTQSHGTKTNEEISFFSLIDTYASIDLPYTVTNSTYDEKTKTAYVVVSLERKKIKKD